MVISDMLLKKTGSANIGRKLPVVGGLLLGLVEALGASTAEQREQLGTGHAVQQALPQLPADEGRTLILFGDVPLVRVESLRKLIESEFAEMAVVSYQEVVPEIRIQPLGRVQL